MIFKETPLKGSYAIELTRANDERGWFMRTYSKDEFMDIGFNGEWVQMNHSYTKTPGTVRGMHYQFPPYGETKVVRCIQGAVFDVIVDIRSDSPTFLQWYGIHLSADNPNMIYIPKGFAHGFQTLTDNCELIYMHSQFFKPGFEGGIRFDDAMINIEWPLPATVISERDLGHGALNRNFKGI